MQKWYCGISMIITYLSRHNTLFFTVCLILIVDFQEMGEKEKTKQIENN